MQMDVRITGPQAAEAALLFRPAAGVDVGDPCGDTQAAAGGTGAPRAGVGEAVPRPGLRLAHGRCRWDRFPVSLQPPQPAPRHHLTRVGGPELQRGDSWRVGF